VQVLITLNSILREALPAENKGVTTLDLRRGTSLGDVMAQLGITGKVFFTVNGKLETDPTRKLRSHDDVHVYVSVHGG
jgi:hypothetical protein